MTPLFSLTHLSNEKQKTKTNASREHRNTRRVYAKKNEQNKNIETIVRYEHFSAEGHFGNNTSCFYGMGELPLKNIEAFQRKFVRKESFTFPRDA